MTGPTQDGFGYAFAVASLTVGSGCLARTSFCHTHRQMDETTTFPAVSANHILLRLGAVSPRLLGGCTDGESRNGPYLRIQRRYRPHDHAG